MKHFDKGPFPKLITFKAKNYTVSSGLRRRGLRSYSATFPYIFKNVH